MPVQRATIAAISSSVDDLAQQPVTVQPLAEALFFGAEPALQLRQSAEAQFGGPVQVVVALGLLGLLPDLLHLLAQRLDPAQRLSLGLPLRAQRVGLCPQVGELLAQFLQPGLAGRVVFLGERGLLDLQAHDPSGELIEFGGHGIDLGPDDRAGLVDQVDGLVRQEPVGYVAVAQPGRRDQRAVGDPHAVEHFQALAQAAQDRDRVLHRAAHRP